MSPTRLGLLLLLGFQLAVASPSPAASLTCEIVPRFMRAYLQNHIRYHRLDQEIEDRTIDAYLRRIDPSRTVLLESEAEQIRRSLGGA